MSRFGDLQVRTSKKHAAYLSTDVGAVCIFWDFVWGWLQKNPMFVLFCFGWLVVLFCFVLFCFFGQSMSCLSKPLKKNTFPEETNQLAIFGFGSSDPPKDPRISDRSPGGERLDHLFKKIVLGVASLGRTVGFFFDATSIHIPVFCSPGKTKDGISGKVLEDVVFPIFCKLFLCKGDIWKVFGGVSLGGNVSYRFIERIINHMQCAATFFFLEHRQYQKFGAFLHPEWEVVMVVGVPHLWYVYMQINIWYTSYQNIDGGFNDCLFSSLIWGHDPIRRACFQKCVETTNNFCKAWQNNHPCQLFVLRYACTIGGVSTKTGTGTNLAFASIYGALKQGDDWKVALLEDTVGLQ